MKERWQRLVARINTLTPRERFLVFACIVVVIAAITEEVFIAPLTRLQAEYARELDKRSAAMEAQRARVEKEVMQHRRTRASELESQIALAQDRIADLDRETAQLGGTASDVAALRVVMERAARQNGHVSLVRVSTAEPAAAPQPGTSAAATGIEVTFAGSYLDLTDYLGALQAALPAARWSALHVNAEVAPPQATVRILTKAAS